jgi:hypothetical protein
MAELARGYAKVPGVDPMTDESPADTLDNDALCALLDQPFTELSGDELMSVKAAYAARGIRIYNSVPWVVVAPLLAGAAIYSKAFLETLAKHNAEALLDAMHARSHGDSKTIAFLAAPNGDGTVKFRVEGDLSDTARLALVEPSVIAEALRGKILRWDVDSKAWRADNAGE